MSTFIDFNAFNKISDHFLINIKIIYVFGHKVTECLVVTKDDKCYAFGENDYGVLGLGHNKQVREPKIINELCDKQIIKFTNGFNHVLALKSDGKIFGWGLNNRGQLGNGCVHSIYNKPKVNKFLMSEFIIDMSCGAYHSIVLTIDKQVFVWGYNSFGQTGNGSEKLFQLTPIKLNAFNNEKIITISCGFLHSMALTDCGHVYSWGYNNCGQLGIEYTEYYHNLFKTKSFEIKEPKIVNIKTENNDSVFITKISCGSHHSLLLSKDGNIYSFGYNKFGQIGNNNLRNQLIPQKISSSLKFIDIASHFLYDISIALSVNNICYIWGKCGKENNMSPKETQFKSVDEIFLNFNQIIYKPIHIFREFETLMNSSSDNELSEKNCDQRNNLEKDLLLLLSPNIISKYKNWKQIEPNFDRKIKVYFRFNDRDLDFPYFSIGKNSLIVTEKDEVFAFGSNSNGLLDSNHLGQIIEPLIVNDLSHKKIIGFNNGFHHVIAITNENKVYIWGFNNSGQLGDGTYDDCFVPQLLNELKDENITTVCCGDWHSLALTSNGKVYAWGSNKFGQIGNERDNEYQLKPIKIEKFEEKTVVAISCGHYHSLALTENGRVYSWGDNERKQLGFGNIIASNVPKLLKIRDSNKSNVIIIKISCGSYCSLLLSSDRDIYAFGCNNFGILGNNCFQNQNIPIKILTQSKFIDIAAHKDCTISVALSVDGIYYIWGYCGQEIITNPKATQFDSFDRIFLNYYGITYKSNSSEIKSVKNSITESQEKSNYFSKFDEFGVISFGSFGIVLKAIKKNENELNAIKKIALNDNNYDSLMNEFKIMTNLKSDYIVEVKSAWIEYNYFIDEGFEKFKHLNIKKSHPIFNPENPKLLHIQMELCYKTLRDIIKQSNSELNQNSLEIMSSIGYYISSELFIETLESVDYLHKQKPQIIHRDLKPTNILIAFKTDGRFVKLADFGLAKLQEFEEQSNTCGVGTHKYMAPEVLSSRKYNTKADVYSLGVIIPELFSIKELVIFLIYQRINT
jgi:alpha-tubulin suppressor-like RCC1 family protein